MYPEPRKPIYPYIHITRFSTIGWGVYLNRCEGWAMFVLQLGVFDIEIGYRKSETGFFEYMDVRSFM